jgi:hypothetical protein
MALLNDIKELKEDVAQIREEGAKREDVKAVNEKVDALDVRFTDRLARLDVKVALGASIGSIVGGGAVALIVSQIH